MVRQEAVADEGDAAEHGFVRVLRVGLGYVGDGERDEGFDPEGDYNVACEDGRGGEKERDECELHVGEAREWLMAYDLWSLERTEC